jgi:hypothetical protein
MMEEQGSRLELLTTLMENGRLTGMPAIIRELGTKAKWPARILVTVIFWRVRLQVITVCEHSLGLTLLVLREQVCLCHPWHK